MVATLEKSNTAEIGVPSGTTVTDVNSGGGTGNAAFSNVNIQPGTTLQVSADAPIIGDMSYLATLVSTRNAVYASWTLAADRADFTYDFVFTIPAHPPTVDMGVARFYTDTVGATVAATLFIDTTGHFYIDDAIDGRTTPVTAVAPTPGNYVAKIRFGGGQISLDIYPHGSATLTAGTILTGLSTFAIRSVDVIRVAPKTGSTSYTWQVDSLRVGFGGFLPRTDTTPAAPTCTTGPDAYSTVGDTVPMTGTDTAPAGVITGRAWTWDTIPTGATPPAIIGDGTGNATFTPTIQGYYKARYQVADNQGSDSTPAYMQTWVAPATGDPVTVRTDTIGTWTTVGGGATSVDRVNDTDTATGVISPGNPTGAAYLAKMNPHGPGGITLTITGNSTAGTITRTIKWYKPDGVTLIDTQTATAPTSSSAQTFTMSDAGLALIPNRSDRAALWVHIESTV